MKSDEKDLDTWIKLDIPNGKILYIKEKKEQDVREEDSHITSGKIKIHKKRRLGTTSLILADSKNDFEGFIEFGLYKDIAKLIERKGDTDLDIETHELLKRYIKYFRNSPGLALFTNEEKRGKGIGKELLYYGFLYLKKKGIDTIDIGSASNEKTKKFYKDNGAIFYEEGGFPKEFNNLEERIKELREKLGIKTQTAVSFPKSENFDR